MLLPAGRAACALHDTSCPQPCSRLAADCIPLPARPAPQKLMGMDAERGALSTLYCATEPELAGRSGAYIGPW